LADILAKHLEQVCSTASILPESGLLHPAMCLKPVTESDNQSRIGGRIRNWFTRANPTPHEMSMEKLHSKTCVIANLSSLEMRASATQKMTTKGIKRVEIEVRQTAAFPLDEAAEMGGSANVSNGAGRRISVAFELIRK
jgi:hypothetical protein